jgi:hypothetical protein
VSAYRILGNYKEAATAATGGLEQAERGGLPAAKRVFLGTEAAMLLYSAQDRDQAAVLVARAIELACASRDPGLLAKVLRRCLDLSKGTDAESVLDFLSLSCEQLVARQLTSAVSTDLSGGGSGYRA